MIAANHFEPWHFRILHSINWFIIGIESTIDNDLLMTASLWRNMSWQNTEVFQFNEINAFSFFCVTFDTWNWKIGLSSKQPIHRRAISVWVIYIKRSEDEMRGNYIYSIASSSINHRLIQYYHANSDLSLFAIIVDGWVCVFIYTSSSILYFYFQVDIHVNKTYNIWIRITSVKPITS